MQPGELEMNRDRRIHSHFVYADFRMESHKDILLTFHTQAKSRGVPRNYIAYITLLIVRFDKLLSKNCCVNFNLDNCTRV